MNPLVLHGLEEERAAPHDLGNEQLLNAIAWDPNARGLKDVRKRYAKLRTIQHGTLIAPAERRILERIISPLR